MAYWKPALYTECARDRWQEHEGEADNDGGHKCAKKELQRADAAVFKLRLQN